MIICGYPGIGKTNTAKYDYGYVDLESSLFKDSDNWVSTYVSVAKSISRQGFNVFVSSHEEVRNELAKLQNDKVILVYPSANLGPHWCTRLKDRYNLVRSDKNYRAFMYVLNNFDESIKKLQEDKRFAMHIEIDHVPYVLDDILTKEFEKAGIIECE